MNEMNENSLRNEGPRIEFRRLTTPLPTGRVRVQIEVRRVSGEGQEKQTHSLLGRIVQTRGGWRFVPAGNAKVGQIATGKVWATAEECKRSLQEWES